MGVIDAIGNFLGLAVDDKKTPAEMMQGSTEIANAMSKPANMGAPVMAGGVRRKMTKRKTRKSRKSRKSRSVGSGQH